MLAGIFLVCVLNIWATSGEIPPSFILHVLPDCNNNWPTNSVVEIATDLSVQIFIECSDGTLEPVTTSDLVHYFAKVYKNSNDGCAFRSPSGSEVYSTVIRVMWGYPSFQVFSEEERYTITCTFDKNGQDSSPSRQISEALTAPGEIAYHHGKSTSATTEIDVVDILGNAFTGSIHLGRKVKIVAKVTAGGSGIRPVTCSAIGTTDGSSVPILLAGCGDGVVIGKTAGFTVDSTVSTSPIIDLFKVPGNDEFKIKCNVTICDSSCDGSTCPKRRRKRHYMWPAGSFSVASPKYRHDPMHSRLLSTNVARETVKITKQELNAIAERLGQVILPKYVVGRNLDQSTADAMQKVNIKLGGGNLELEKSKANHFKHEEGMEFNRAGILLSIDFCIVMLSVVIGLVACIKLGPRPVKRNEPDIVPYQPDIVPYLSILPEKAHRPRLSKVLSPKISCRPISDIKDYYKNAIYVVDLGSLGDSVSAGRSVSDLKSGGSCHLKPLLDNKCQCTPNCKANCDFVMDHSISAVEFKNEPKPKDDVNDKCLCPFAMYGTWPEGAQKCPCDPTCHCKPQCGCRIAGKVLENHPKCNCPFVLYGTWPNIESTCPCEPSCHCKPKCGCRKDVSECGCPFAADDNVPDAKVTCPCKPECHCKPKCGCTLTGKPELSTDIGNSDKGNATLGPDEKESDMQCKTPVETIDASISGHPRPIDDTITSDQIPRTMDSDSGNMHALTAVVNYDSNTKTVLSDTLKLTESDV